MQRETTTQSWNSYWSEFESPNFINFTPALVDAIGRHTDLKGARVLEIGVGTGGNSAVLAEHGAEIIALDFSRQALERSRHSASLHGVNFALVEADGRALPFADGSIDVVFHQGFLEHFVSPGDLLIDQHRILRTGGFLLVDVPQRYNLYTVHKHRLIKAGNWPYGGWESEFSSRELENLIRSVGFDILESYGRGYFPRIIEMMHNLPRADRKLLKRDIIPQRAKMIYEQSWGRLEKTWLGKNTLQCIGVMAIKV